VERPAVVKDFDTGKRVATVHPESEWKVTECPERSVVDAEVWDAVQAVRAQKSVRLGAPQLKKTSTPSPLGALVKCGVCGGPMSSSGQVHGGRSFRCSIRRSKGKHGPCSNSRGIQEARVLEFVAATAQQAMEAEKGDAVYADFERMLTNSELRRGSKGPNLAALDAAVRKARARAECVADTLMRVGVSELLRARLREAEAELSRRVADREAADAAPATAGDSWTSRASAGAFRAYMRQVWQQFEDVLCVPASLKLGPWRREHLERIVCTGARTQRAP
jgi:hypothetical protein